MAMAMDHASSNPTCFLVSDPATEESAKEAGPVSHRTNIDIR
jgi:hypothetical protein